MIWAAVAISLLMLLLTAPENTGDAMDYASDVAQARSAWQPPLFEPGHLLWRSSGVLLRELTGGSTSLAPSALRDAQRMLGYVSMLAVTLASVMVGIIALRWAGSTRAGVVAAVLTATATVSINYGQAGTSYLPAFAFYVLGVLLALEAGRTRGALAGVAFAASTLFWLPFVLAVPAGLLTVFLLGRGTVRERLLVMMLATVACATLGFAAFLAAAAANGIHTPHEFLGWLTSSSHGISRPGLARVAVGLPRSFIHMGDDGREVRRFLVGDPLNPVTARDLVRLTLWPRLVIFYLMTAMAVWRAWVDRIGRLMLGPMVLATVPLVTFAASWSGGEEERYLPLMVYLILVLAFMVDQVLREGRRVLSAGSALLGAAWLLNVSAFGPTVTRNRSRAIVERLGCLMESLDARAVFVIPNTGDPLETFYRDRLDEAPRNREARVVHLVPATVFEGLTWQESLEHAIASTRTDGGRVLVPSYVRDSAPPRWAAWVEGSQYGVTWDEIRQAYGRHTLTPPCSPTAFLEVRDAP